MLRRTLMLLLFVGFGAIAETPDPGCYGPFYPGDPACNGNCGDTCLANSVDPSVFQCCPPDATVPEMPSPKMGIALPLGISALVIAFGRWRWVRRRRSA